MNRKILHYLCTALVMGLFSFSFQTTNAQAVAEIAAYPGTSGNIVTGSSGYHVSESIFLSSEVGATNFLTTATAINRLEFNVQAVGSPILFNNYSVYLKEVPAATTTFATGTYSLTGYTQVYTGDITFSATGWSGIDLTTPFTRTLGTNNVQVLITRTDGVARTGFIYLASRGNSTDSAALTTRRYNSTTAPVAGTSSLTGSLFRLAIRFINKAANDAAVASISTPSSSCHSSVSIPVTIQNYGTLPIAAGAASVTLSLSGANTASSTLTNAAAIAPGSTGSVTFTGINAAAPGVNNVTATVAYVGDGNAVNDTARAAFTTVATATTFPVLEGAENNPLDYFLYLRLLSGSQAWGLQTGKVKNADLSDSLAPHGGSKFYVFDSYNVQSSDAILYSSCMSLPAAGPSGNNYYVSFWMSHDTSFTAAPNTFLDSIYLVISTDKGVTWTRLQGFQRNDPAYATPGWGNHQVDIPNYQGQTVQIGFEGVSKYGNLIGLDDIKIVAESSLPVTLVNFSGERVGSSNVLDWSTASETNNTGFELQRSADGINFSKLSFVKSKSEGGNSGRNLRYDFVDKAPFQAANYYRLKQIDVDGKFNYSKIILVKGSKANALSVAAIYPNPVVNNLKVVIASPKNTNVTVLVSDLAGKVVLQQSSGLIEGDNYLNLNVKSIANGTYSIKVVSNDGYNSPVTRFVKQ